MTAPGSISLARVTVAAPQRRIDVALPDSLVVAELLPHLLRHAGEQLADEGELHGGWVLRRATGTTLDASRSLAGQGVRDGEVLHLAPGRVDWPEFAYDDVVEVIASGSRRSGRAWGNQATRQAGFVLAGVTFGVGLLQVVLAGPPWKIPALLSLAVGALLVFVGVLVARAFADARAGAALAGFGLPFAFVGGLLLAAPDGVALLRLGAPNLLLGSAVLLVGSIIGYVGAGALHRVFMAGIVSALMGALAAALCLAGMSAAGGAAVALTVVTGLLPGYPLFATWLGKMPVPRLPDRAEDLLAERTMPERSVVFAAVARAAELLSGMLTGAAVVSLAATLVLVGTDNLGGRLLAFAGAATLLLRARLFPSYAQRVPLIVGGTGGMVVLVLGASLTASTTQGRLLILGGVLVCAATILLAGLAYSRERPSPYIGRFGDIVDVLVIMALIPLACAATGVFGAIQGLFASMGG